MKTPDADEVDGRLMRAALDAAPPPPSPEMVKALGTMTPVRTRSRFGAFLLVLVLGAIGPAYTLIHAPLRRDLGALPPAWVVIGAALWSLTFMLSLAAALVPARGDVLPSAERASRASVIGMGALLLFSALWTAHAPGISLRPEDLGQTMIQSGFACGRYVLQIAAIFLALGFIVLRRVLPVGGRRIGLAIGAAGGAVAGLALHFHCPIASTGHVLISHAGVMVLGSLAGALILHALLER